jgi:AmpD protein
MITVDLKARLVMQIKDHRLSETLYIESPNQDDRPVNEVCLIVIHGISLPPGKFGGDEVTRLFTNTLESSDPVLSQLKDLRVSSHLYVRRDGSVVQFVPFNKRAWHAGQSEFAGRQGCNDFSVGIELEGTDTTAYEPAQYESLAEICGALMNAYGATEIAGHCHIAPARKTDPGEAFDWLLLSRKLARLL